ncbi:MAG: DUF2461 domain-containing protein [Devosia sp.]|nr:DUF2461 domain-containing protein [Devosia sp.]
MTNAAFAGFPAATFEFLSGITAHNEKAWFDANRPLYEAGYVEPAKAFVAELGPQLRDVSPTVHFDPKVNGSIGRVNRDIRFSKDKRPYKTHLDLIFWHGDRKGWDRPGFWFRLMADEVWLGCGLHGMQGEVLESFRQSVIHPRSAKALLAAAAIVEAAGAYEIGDRTRKLMPRGYVVDGPTAAYLLNESLHATIRLPAEAVRAPTFLATCLAHYRAMWPIGQWLLDEVSGT